MPGTTQISEVPVASSSCSILLVKAAICTCRVATSVCKVWMVVLSVVELSVELPSFSWLVFFESFMIDRMNFLSWGCEEESKASVLPDMIERIAMTGILSGVLKSGFIFVFTYILKFKHFQPEPVAEVLFVEALEVVLVVLQQYSR